MDREDANRARAEGQRLRIIRLLESLADVEEREQCTACGEWFQNVGSHRQHCDGP